ncbi:MAG: hypothetical protein RR573_07645 [Oscillospiraceae bacterium]
MDNSNKTQEELLAQKELQLEQKEAELNEKEKKLSALDEAVNRSKHNFYDKINVSKKALDVFICVCLAAIIVCIIIGAVM